MTTINFFTLGNNYDHALYTPPTMMGNAISKQQETYAKLSITVCKHQLNLQTISLDSIEIVSEEGFCSPGP